MSIFKNYKNYLKDNPNHLWFKRKLYGWGWTPVTWQGWLVTLLYIAMVLLLTLFVDEKSPSSFVFTFFLPLAILTVIIFCIAYKKGESPKWMWGPPKEDDKDSE